MGIRENKRNYYRVLFIQPDAPLEVIQASYRTLMQKRRAHPDLGGDAWNAAVINEAYRTLSDDQRRAAYDRRLFSSSGYSVSGRQHPIQQRQRAQARGDDADAWQPFRPVVLD